MALQIAIKTLGLSSEVITTPFSYVATTSSIVWENCERHLRYAAGLCAQIGYLVIYGLGLRQISMVVFAVLRDGVFGQLGPVRPDFSRDVLP